MRQSFLNLSVLAKAHLSRPKELGWLFLELELVPAIQVWRPPENGIKSLLITLIESCQEHQP
jgi:hypothetical protein